MATLQCGQPGNNRGHHDIAYHLNAAWGRHLNQPQGWIGVISLSLSEAVILHTISLLLSSVQNQVGWSIFIVLFPGQPSVCVCVHACFHIVLHVFGISTIQITSLEHTLLLNLSLSLVC